MRYHNTDSKQYFTLISIWFSHHSLYIYFLQMIAGLSEIEIKEKLAYKYGVFYHLQKQTLKNLIKTSFLFHN